MGLSCAMVPEGMTDQEAQARWDAPSVLHLAFRFLEFRSRDQKIAIGRFRAERPFADGAALARASQSALRRGQALAGDPGVSVRFEFHKVLRFDGVAFDLNGNQFEAPDLVSLQVQCGAFGCGALDSLQGHAIVPLAEYFATRVSVPPTALISVSLCPPPLHFIGPQIEAELVACLSDKACVDRHLGETGE